MTWQIVFYNRDTGNISRKHGYKRWQDAADALRKNGFTEDSAQLQRLVTEERPGACLGCGFEHNCRRDGCAVLRKVSRIVARGGGEDDSWHHL